jgi:hypothetical protein
MHEHYVPKSAVLVTGRLWGCYLVAVANICLRTNQFGTEWNFRAILTATSYCLHTYVHSHTYM